MALTSTPVFVQTPKLGVQNFVQGTDASGTPKTVYSAGTNGSKVIGLWMNNTDSSNTHTVTVQLVRAAVAYGGAALVSVVSAGFLTAVPAQTLMSPGVWPGLPLDSDGNPYLLLQSGDSIQASYTSGLATSSVINVTAIGADF